MSEIRELLGLNFPEIILGMVVILLCFKSMSELYDWFKKRLRARFVKSEKMETDHELLMRHNQELKEQKKQIDRIFDSVESITVKLDNMSIREDESERRKLKDRIAQAYRSYHDKGEWTSMEKEAFFGLIEDYESRGGSNSFVHEICQPESYTWKIVK